MKKSGTKTSRPVPTRKVTSGSSAPGATFGDWLEFLGIDPTGNQWEPSWPPDVFAVAAAILRRTGGYATLLTSASAGANSRLAEELGVRWRDELSKNIRRDGDFNPKNHLAPIKIRVWFSALLKGRRKTFQELSTDSTIRKAALRLCAASDTACAGIGITPKDNVFLSFAQRVLARRNFNRSFCYLINPERLVVLGKQHTPQRGCTIRSISHHLSLYVPSEIDAIWYGPFEPAHGELDVLNLLLLPWPTEIQTRDFSLAERVSTSDTTTHGRKVGAKVGVRAGDGSSYRYFEYVPVKQDSPSALKKKIKSALRLARNHADSIHGVVLPEMALDVEQYRVAEKIVAEAGAMLISGVRVPGRNVGSGSEVGMPQNVCAIQPLGLTSAASDLGDELSAVLEYTRHLQLKHHRWCLDRNQVLQYGLGGRIPASKDCWEHIHVGDRSIAFVTLMRWLTTCALLCEDLARQEPVAEVIRAVGPNLVIALLMDGPQLRHRWSSRYASVLAEDPGCSVLTLTSLGMVNRSRPLDQSKELEESSPVVALWRDALYGEREISIPAGHNACVLSLVSRRKREYTLDDRHDESESYFPVFAGSYTFKV